MSVTLNGTTGYLELASKIVSAYPYTLAIWAGRANTATAMSVIEQQQSNADRSHRIYFQAGTDAVVGRVSTNVSGGVSVINSAAIPNATMKLLMFVVTSPSSMSLYHDSATPATAVAVADDISNHDRFTIGADHYNSAAATNFLAGPVAEAAVFNVALTASDFTAMKGGTLAETIGGCVKCFPLRNITDLTSTDGLSTLTLVGGVTNTGSHPVSRSSSTIACAVGAAAASGAQASIQGSVTIAASVGNAAAAGSAATITNSTASTTIACAVGNAAAAGLTAAFGTFVQSDQLINNTGALLPSTAVYWTWTPAGRIGSMVGITPVDGTGTTDANARLAPGIARAAGKLDIAVRAAAAVDDAVYCEMFA